MYGTARTIDGWTYTFTDEDLLWLARALWGEGGERSDAVAWTLFQRYALPNIRESKFSSFAAQVRAYSQPVNPRWRLGGDFCETVGGSYCTRDQLERREMISTTPWAEIPQQYRDVATAFVEGRLRNPVPGATHFAMPHVLTANHLERDPDGLIVLKDGGSNWFWADSRTKNYLPNWVTVEGMGMFAEVPWREIYAYADPQPTDAVAKAFRASGASNRLTIVALFAGAGALGYFAYRRLRR